MHDGYSHLMQFKNENRSVAQKGGEGTSAPRFDVRRETVVTFALR